MKAVRSVLSPLFSRPPSGQKPCREEGTQPHPPGTHTDHHGDKPGRFHTLSSDPFPQLIRFCLPCSYIDTHTQTCILFFLFWQTCILNRLFSVHNFLSFHFWFLSRLQLSFQRQCHLGPAGVTLHWE